MKIMQAQYLTLVNFGFPLLLILLCSALRWAACIIRHAPSQGESGEIICKFIVFQRWQKVCKKCAKSGETVGACVYVI